MKRPRPPKRVLHRYFDRMLSVYGPQHWWPARGRFEVMVGAILTQNAAWRNVEKAIARLKRSGLMNPTALDRVSVRRLSRVIRPSGYFNVKARRLKAFVRFLMKAYDGKPDRMFREPVLTLRSRLLSVHGIGPETADSILLYAGRFPVFVIDTYTRRVLTRHRLVPRTRDYDQLQRYFMKRLRPSTPLFNEFHALLVLVGKEHCRRMPICTGCPLESFLGGRRPKI